MGFVLIDRIVELERGSRARALTTFRIESDVFEDHFPGVPIVPGVLVTEAMGQVGGWLIVATLGFTRWPLLTMIDRAKFRRLVRPGEEIEITAEVRSARVDDYEIGARATVAGERAAEATLRFHLVHFQALDQEGGAIEAWARATWHQLGGPHLRAGGESCR